MHESCGFRGEWKGPPAMLTAALITTWIVLSATLMAAGFITTEDC